MRGPMRSGGVLQARDDVGRLDPDHLGAQVDGVVERLLEVAAAVERLVLDARRLDDDGHQRRVDRRGEHRGAPDARGVAGLPSTSTSTRSVTSGSC